MVTSRATMLSKIDNMFRMFDGAVNLRVVDLRTLEISSKRLDLEHMFSNTLSLSTVYFHFNVSCLHNTYIKDMFLGSIFNGDTCDWWKYMGVLTNINGCYNGYDNFRRIEMGMVENN